MTTAEIRVVEQEYVALVDVVAEKFDDGFSRPGQGADMDWNVLCLSYQYAVCAA